MPFPSVNTLNDINYRFVGNISYDDVSTQLDQLLKFDGQNRTDALKLFTMQIASQLVQNSANIRALCFINEHFTEKYQNTGLLTSTPDNALACAKALLVQMIEEKMPDEKIEINFSLEEKRDFTLEEVSKVNIANVYKEYSNVVDGHRLLLELDQAKEKFQTTSFSVDDRKSWQFKAMADLYLNYNFKKENMSKHGWVWKLFHPIENYRCNKFFKETEKLFEKTGFNVTEHADVVMEYARTTQPQPFDTDRSSVIEGYESALIERAKAERLKNTPELNVARDKLKEAKERDKNPQTAFVKNITPILDKYGFEHKFSVPENGYNAALDYDQLRDFEAAKMFSARVFNYYYREMFSRKRESGEPIDMAEIIKDAHKITIAAVKNYTVSYEAEEGKDYIRELTVSAIKSDDIKRGICFMITGSYKDSDFPEKDNLYQAVDSVIEERENNIDKYLKEDQAYLDQLESKVSIEVIEASDELDKGKVSPKIDSHLPVKENIKQV